MSERFIDQVLAGEALWRDVDDWVERWHSGDGPPELRDHLGMTEDEYGLWVERPETLRLILRARERAEPLADLVADPHRYALAARDLSAHDKSMIDKWLRETGRLPA